MVRVSLLEMAQPTPKACDSCTFGDCRFSKKRVKLYCIVLRQCRILREPFEIVLRSHTRNSRAIDPWLSTGSYDPYDARCIGWAVEEVGRTHGIDVTNPWNANRLASLLCPERHAEGEPVDDMILEGIS